MPALKRTRNGLRQETRAELRARMVDDARWWAQFCASGAPRRGSVQPPPPFVAPVIYIVGCGARKIWHDRPDAGPQRARHAYVGPFHGAAKRYAEATGYPWHILSARYGLVDPDFPIPGDYDTRLPRRVTRGERDAFASMLRSQARAEGLFAAEQVVVLAGRAYVDALKDALGEQAHRLHAPLADLRGIGHMLARLRDARVCAIPLHCTPGRSPQPDEV